MKPLYILLASFSIALLACTQEEIEPVVTEPSTPNLKYLDVSYIIQDNCVGCHSYGGSAEASGVFSYYEGLEVGLDNSTSNFIDRLQSNDEDYRMPPSGEMSAAQIDSLISWINSGYIQ